ncbi:MAG: polyprenyl diphosphate synthase [Rhabdochlamydiaceae bacterium]
MKNSCLNPYCIDEDRIPEHVAIIMDGNRRWARKHRLPSYMGHWEGADVVNKILKVSADLGIKILTLYAFSTENWNRSKEEVNNLMFLLTHYLNYQKNIMLANGVKLSVIGDREPLSANLKKSILDCEQTTQYGGKIELVLALNYGGRNDLKRAFVRMIDDCEKGVLKKEDLSEKIISGYLDTCRWKDPDLLIRTSGEKRLSNFLLWQISYTEIYMTDLLWPEFNEEELRKAILDYQKRDRRVGGK